MLIIIGPERVKSRSYLCCHAIIIIVIIIMIIIIIIVRRKRRIRRRRGRIRKVLSYKVSIIIQCQLKIRSKRKVFSLVLKVVNHLQLLMSSGREFHNTGAIYENALRPYVLISFPCC